MKLINTALAVTLIMTSSSLFAEEKPKLNVSGNLTITSEYIWRGMAQSDGSSVVQGNFDLDYNGYYTGVWSSAIKNDKASSEFNVYLGYTNEIDKLSYDIAYTHYIFPNNTDALNFAELTLALTYSFDIFDIGGAYFIGIDTNSVEGEVYKQGNAYEFYFSYSIVDLFTFDAMYGLYDDAQNENENQYGSYSSLSLSKSFGSYDYTLAYNKMDYEDKTKKDEDSVVATISSSF